MQLPVKSTHLLPEILDLLLVSYWPGLRLFALDDPAAHYMDPTNNELRKTDRCRLIAFFPNPVNSSVCVDESTY